MNLREVHIDVQVCSPVARRQKGGGQRALRKSVERSSDQIFILQRFDLQKGKIKLSIVNSQPPERRV